MTKTVMIIKCLIFSKCTLLNLLCTFYLIINMIPGVIFNGIKKKITQGQTPSRLLAVYEAKLPDFIVLEIK